MGRVRGLSANARSGLSAFATGILVFLLWDVLTHAVDPIEAALTAHRYGRFSGLAALGVAGFTAGLMSLVYYDAWMKKRANRRASTLVGPGAAAIDEFADRKWLDLTTPAHTARVPHRHRHRRAQLRRRPRDRPGGRGEPDQPRSDADHRLRPAQRDRGLRYLRTADGRRHPPELEAARGPRPHRRRARRSSARSSARRGRATPSASSSSPSRPDRSCTSSASCFAVNRRYGHPVLVTWLMLIGIIAGFATDFVVTAAGV